MYLLPLFTTFLSSLISGFSRKIGTRGTAITSVLLLLISFLSSLIVWYEVSFGNCTVKIVLFDTWFTVGSLYLDWTIYIDLYTAQMYLTVTMVSSAVHLYALVYMRNDPHLSLFMSYLSLFTFFMVVLVSSDNLIGMLVGWEGIGVCSYLLIGYWSHRLSAVKSAQKAILVNRVSDGLLLWGVLYIWYHTGSLEYDMVLMNAAPYMSSFLSLALLIGAMGKSAQILFHVWLADAMEGPTPVSALIHAATLVTAGVYVMVRLSIFYDELILLVGSLTALMAGIFGYFQSDLKRVIAFSTCSQLGYMMVSVGLGHIGAEASMSHLMTHASFKAALFLAAGVIITGSGSGQHTARYGGLTGYHCSILCFLTFLIGCLCLMAFPETSGFYSKEAIINLSFISLNPFSDYSHSLLLIAAFITCTYTVKLLVQCFFNDFSGLNFNIGPTVNTSNILITGAFLILLFDIVLKILVGNGLLSGILFFIPWGVKTLPFGLMIAGILTATAAITSKSFGIIRFSATRWGFDQMYARILVSLVFDWGRISWTKGDKGVFLIGYQKVLS